MPGFYPVLFGYWRLDLDTNKTFYLFDKDMIFFLIYLLHHLVAHSFFFKIPLPGMNSLDFKKVMHVKISIIVV